jgi:hypothetical protein
MECFWAVFEQKKQKKKKESKKERKRKRKGTKLHMNFLRGSDDDESKPLESDIIEANSVIQDLVNTNEVRAIISAGLSLNFFNQFLCCNSFSARRSTSFVDRSLASSVC